MRISIYLYIYIFPAVAASERGRSFDRIHWDDKIQPKATDKQEKTTQDTTQHNKTQHKIQQAKNTTHSCALISELFQEFFKF